MKNMKKITKKIIAVLLIFGCIGMNGVYAAASDSEDEDMGLTKLFSPRRHEEQANAKLREAIFDYCPKAVLEAISAGAQINGLDKNNQTPLIYFFTSNSTRAVCADNDIKILNILINKGAKINQADFYGNTALFYAYYGCNALIERYAQTLLDRGAKVNHKNNNGSTPLISSCKRGFLSYPSHIEELLRRGADVNLKDKRRYSALDYYISVGAKKPTFESSTPLRVVKLLLKHGANINFNFFTHPLILQAQKELAQEAQSLNEVATAERTRGLEETSASQKVPRTIVYEFAPR